MRVENLTKVSASNCCLNKVSEFVGDFVFEAELAFVVEYYLSAVMAALLSGVFITKKKQEHYRIPQLLSSFRNWCFFFNANTVQIIGHEYAAYEHPIA